MKIGGKGGIVELEAAISGDLAIVQASIPL